MDRRPDAIAAFARLSLMSRSVRPRICTACIFHSPTITAPQTARRPFSQTTSRSGNWLMKTFMEKTKSPKGRPRVHTGGSSRGTTVIWGDYGLRMSDHHRRVSASQLKIGQEAIKVRLKGLKYRLYTRINADQAVYKKGNEVRMGKGKGSFDHWAAKIGVNKVIFELRGDLHEQVVQDAFRLAGAKMPGLYEFVKKGDPPVVGITKLDGVTLEELKRPRRKIPLDVLEPGMNELAPGRTVSTEISPAV